MQRCAQHQVTVSADPPTEAIRVMVKYEYEKSLKEGRLLSRQLGRAVTPGRATMLGGSQVFQVIYEVKDDLHVLFFERSITQDDSIVLKPGSAVCEVVLVKAVQKAMDPVR
jgi:hypothetical protein